MGLRAQPRTEGSRRQLDLSPAYFSQTPAAVERLRPWLRRELGVLCGERGVDVVVNYVLGLLRTADFRFPATFTNLLRQFLFSNTEHFVHELACFARSSLDLSSYDRYTRYAAPGPAHAVAAPLPARIVRSQRSRWHSLSPGGVLILGLFLFVY
jgi:hypothetical protein